MIVVAGLSPSCGHLSYGDGFKSVVEGVTVSVVQEEEEAGIGVSPESLTHSVTFLLPCSTSSMLLTKLSRRLVSLPTVTRLPDRLAFSRFSFFLFHMSFTYLLLLLDFPDITQNQAKLFYFNFTYAWLFSEANAMTSFFIMY